MFKNRCYNGGKQHKFEPRYSEVHNDSMPTGTLRYFTLQELKAFFVLKKYDCDVCVWCGQIVKKKGY